MSLHIPVPDNARPLSLSERTSIGGTFTAVSVSPRLVSQDGCGAGISGARAVHRCAQTVGVACAGLAGRPAGAFPSAGIPILDSETLCLHLCRTAAGAFSRRSQLQDDAGAEPFKRFPPGKPCCEPIFNRRKRWIYSLPLQLPVFSRSILERHHLEGWGRREQQPALFRPAAG